MLNKPATLHYFLSNHGLIDGFYAAMAKDDTAELVMITLDALKKLSYIPPLVKAVKSEETSTAFRNEGNTAYRARKFQKTLELYNKALLHAPYQSMAMKLAYSNRSALLLKVKAFSSCMCDIDLCFSMGCPEYIAEKLRRRRAQALQYIWVERLTVGEVYSAFGDGFFKLNTRRNPQIPCASTAVGVIMEDQVPQVVATTDIKVGTVVAVETAFVSQAVSQNHYSSCHHCQKMGYNLIPCNRCCFALFCDEDCMEICYDEYHGVECQIIEIVETIAYGSMSILAIQAAVKMRNMCKSWDELVASSTHFGVDRMRNSSINEIFDVNKKFSLLSFRDNIHFIHGAMYNSSFACAVIIHYLDSIGTFFPESPVEKNEAMRAIARISMFLSMYGTHTQITPAVSVAMQGKTEFHDTANFGWFSFTGKLKHGCQPNLVVAGLNSAVALIAIEPIKRGTELTIPYLGHFLDCPFNKKIHNKNMFSVYGIACNCNICSGEWETNDGYQLTDIQRRNFRRLNLDHLKEIFNLREIPDMYQKLCNSLAVLHDVPFSKEYKEVYEMFKKCVLALQNTECDNKTIDYIRGHQNL